MIGIAIPCSKHEDWSFVQKAWRRIKEFKLDRNVVYAIEDCKILKKNGIDAYCVETRPGVGRARERLYEVVKSMVKDVTWVLYMDAHVYLSNLIPTVIGKVLEFSTTSTVIVVPRVAIWKLDGSLDSSAWADGSYFTYHGLKWVYIYNFGSRPEPILGSNEPMYFVKIGFLERLKDIRGFMYLPYWGFEIFDITISAWRLGYEVWNVPIIAGYHLWRPSFPKGRFEDEKLWSDEPWFSYAKAVGFNPFHFSIELNKYMYLLAHYPEKDLENMVMKLDYRVRNADGFLPIDRRTLRSFAMLGKPLYAVYERFRGKYNELW